MKSYHCKRFKKKQDSKIIKQYKPLFYINIALFVGILFVGVGYFIQVNAHASKGFTLLDIEKRIDTLEKEQRKLELEAVNLSSMNAVQGRLDGKGFVENGDVEYFFVNSGVAKK